MATTIDGERVMEGGGLVSFWGYAPGVPGISSASV